MILKEVDLEKSHFDYLVRNQGKIKVGMSVCPGTRHSPGRKIRHEVREVVENEKYAIVQEIHVQSRWDKPIGKYKIVWDGGKEYERY